MAEEIVVLEGIEHTPEEAEEYGAFVESAMSEDDAVAAVEVEG